MGFEMEGDHGRLRPMYENLDLCGTGDGRSQADVPASDVLRLITGSSPVMTMRGETRDDERGCGTSLSLHGETDIGSYGSEPVGSIGMKQ